MIRVDAAISRFRRDLVLAALLRGALAAAAAACMFIAPLLGLRDSSFIALCVIGAVWLMLSYRSVIGTRMAADSPLLIAAGQFDQAEDRIDVALRTFSLFRTGKLLSLHHLALLRHAQRRWRESAQLCQTLLAQRLGNIPGLSRATLLMMVDSMLQMGDLRGAHQALETIYQYRLNLSEALTLQLLQLDYGARIGAWDSMLAGVGSKVQMAELMPTLNAARAQALLAVAARKQGRADLAQWLRKRAELLCDPAEFVAGHPVLDAEIKALAHQDPPDARKEPTMDAPSADLNDISHASGK